MRNVLNLIAQYKELDLHSIVDYYKFNSYAITHHSTALEGSTLTEEETVAPGTQLLLPFSAHFDLVSIHPFYDGKGPGLFF
ncbi:MAG: hypothetical protein LBN98_00655 [Prevotellaceae bacterium]|jgi:Fic family protein|nr:hypothetical protein [Prevotellaceae bacterium]